MDKAPLPKAGKRPDVAAYVESVKAVLDEAHSAASAAFINYMQSVRAPNAGQGSETYNACAVVGYDLDVPLRNALRVLGALKSGQDGSWLISDFEKRAKSKSSVAQRSICDAACAVLLKRFPGEGTFIVKC